MPQVIPLTGRQKVLRYLACYISYFLLLALGVVVVFMIWRRTIIVLLAAFLADSRWNDFLYLLSMVLLGTGLFILVMAAEPYLRTGVPRCQLLRRFTRLAVPLGLAGLLGVLVQEVILAMLL